MKKEELTEIGLTEEQIQKVFAINGKDIEAKKAEIEAKKAEIARIEGERDNFKALYETAENQLKNFDGVDPEKLQQEIQAGKDALAQAKADFDKKITSRDQADWISKKLDEYGVTSPYARRQITSDIQSDDSGLTWKEGSFFGFDDFMKSAKQKDPTLYQTAEEKAEAEKERKQEEDAPKFTSAIGTSGTSDKGGKTYTPPKIF